MKNIELPEQLKEFQNTIEESARPFIRITAEKSKTLLWESKIGGYPYFPCDDKNYPKDENQKPMRLLAQINFSQVPNIDLFPSKGILQFFISAEDDVYGSNFDDRTCQENFRIIYHREVIEDEDKLVTDFSFLDNLEGEDFPMLEEGRMIFTKDTEPVSPEDYHFEKYFGESSDSFLDKFDDEVRDFYYDNFSSDGHKIGGYAFFTQYDPRENEYRDDRDYNDYDVLLLQLDSDDTLSMMWGDCGVANFFIRKKDLIDLNFSNVLYNWDCC